MKGSRILGFVCAAMSGAALVGYLSGATHQLALAIPFAILAIVLLSRKTFTR